MLHLRPRAVRLARVEQLESFGRRHEHVTVVAGRVHPDELLRCEIVDHLEGLAVDDEERALLDALLEAGLPPARMMPGTGACALPDAIELTRRAVQAGCGGVLMLPPFYYKGVSDEGLFRYFASVIDAVADERLRIYLYHIPPVSQVPITRGLIARLLKAYPRAIAGMKDSSGDWNNTKAMLEDAGGVGAGSPKDAASASAFRAGAGADGRRRRPGAGEPPVGAGRRHGGRGRLPHLEPGEPAGRRRHAGTRQRPPSARSRPAP